jgi:large conductance mechanosensitive channel
MQCVGNWGVRVQFAGFGEREDQLNRCWGTFRHFFPSINSAICVFSPMVLRSAADKECCGVLGGKRKLVMLKEFKDFIAKGNVMDMAVGIIIGAAFTAIVKSMVGDLINPFIGLFMGGVDFTNMYAVLSGEVAAGASLEAAREAGAAVFAYGAFIMAVINFLIIAFVVFMLVRYVNKAKDAAKKEEEAVVEAAPAGPTELDVLQEIRDALKK